MSAASYITIVLQIILWALVFVYTFEYFIRSRVNRLRFRYWSVVAFFSMLHLIFAIAYVKTKLNIVQDIMLLMLVIINVNMFEVFMYTAHNVVSRRTEQRLRIVFPLLLVIHIATNLQCFIVIAYIVLIYLAYVSKKNHFIVSYVLYISSAILSAITGYVALITLIAGLIYSIHIMIGIKKMYTQEQIDEKIINNMKE